MSKKDEIREMYMNLTAAMEVFRSALSTYIHNAEYPISYLMRDLNGKISCAEMLLDGGPRVLLRADEWEVFMPVEGNPINTDMLEKWEATEIDKEISYHSTQLNKLMERKEELKHLEKFEPLMIKAGFSVRTNKVLMTFCNDHMLDYNTLTVKYFTKNFTQMDLLRTKGGGRTSLNEIKGYLKTLGYNWK